MQTRMAVTDGARWSYDPQNRCIRCAFYQQQTQNNAAGECVAHRCYRCYSGVGGQFGWVRFFVVCFLYKTNPNPRKTICRGEKVARMPLLNLIFLGLGWPWVGEFEGFIIMFLCFPTEQNLVPRYIANAVSCCIPGQRGRYLSHSFIVCQVARTSSLQVGSYMRYRNASYWEPDQN